MNAFKLLKKNSSLKNVLLVKQAPDLQKVSPIVNSLKSKLKSFCTYTTRYRIAQKSKITILDRLKSNLEITEGALQSINSQIVNIVFDTKPLQLQDRLNMYQILENELKESRAMFINLEESSNDQQPFSEEKDLVLKLQTVNSGIESLKANFAALELDKAEIEEQIKKDV